MSDPNDDLGMAKRPFRVVAVIPVHERLELLPLTITRLYKKNGVDRVICVGDGRKEKAICIEAGALWVTHPNKPLGAKWNYGYQAAKELKPDAVLYVGSSDWICEDWISIMRPYMEEYHIVGVPGMSLIHIADTIRACHWSGYNTGPRKDESIGLGRMISADLLHRIGWKPFDDKKDTSMDGTMKSKCVAVGCKHVFVNDERLYNLSISTARWRNLHKFEDHWQGRLPSERIDPALIIQKFPEVNDLISALQ